MTVGSIGAGAGAIFGSGAFTTVSAERKVKLSAAGDASGKIGLQPGSGDDIVTTASSDVGAVIELADSSINEDAITVYNAALEISSNADEDIDIYVDDSTKGVGSELFFVNDTSTSDHISNPPSSGDSDEISGDGTGTNAITISPSESAKTIDIVIDLTGSHGSSDPLPDSTSPDSDDPIKFVANPTN